MAENMVVGKDLSISRITSTMKEAQPLNLILLSNKWTSIAYELETPNRTIERIRSDYLADRIGLEGVVVDLIVDWVGRRGRDNVTISEFIRVLEGEGLGRYADALRKEFTVNPISSSPESDTSIELNNELQRRRDHIKNNLPNLIRMTMLFPSVTAFLGSKGILTDEDEDELDSHVSKLQKNKHFFKMMQNRPEHYDALIEAFRDQNGVQCLLKGIYHTK